MKKNSHQKENTIISVCRMCGNLCGISVKVKDNQVLSISGDPSSPVSRGRICIKGSTAPQSLFSSRRLKKPLKKNAQGKFEEIPLGQALTEIAAKLEQIQSDFTPRSIGIWKGEGVDFQQQEAIARRFTTALGTPNYFSNDSQCFSGRYLAHKLNYGDYLIPDLENTKLILSWGSNSPMSHVSTMRQINEGRKKGAKLVVIDTRFTELARVSDLFLQVKPGSDIYLAYYIINRIAKRDLFDSDFLAAYSLGSSELFNYAQQIEDSIIFKETGLSEDALDPLDAMLTESVPQITSIAGTGLEHQANGVNTLRAITIIDALVGAIDIPGGMLLPHSPPIQELTLYDSINLDHLAPIGAGKYPILYAIRKEAHTLTLMEQILTGKPYPFKALIMTGANPVLTNANSEKVKRALGSLDLFVVKDLFLSETAELADYVLPAASYLEREELFVDPYTQTLRLTSKCIDLGLQTEYELFRELSRLLGIEKYFPWETDEELNQWLLETTDMKVDDLKKSPSGLYYGKRVYNKHRDPARGFYTPSKKVEISSSILSNFGYDGLPIATPAPTTDENYPLILSTGARKQIFTNSKNRDIPLFMEIMPRGYVEIHPFDAELLGISTGDPVTVQSRTNQFQTQAFVTQEHELQIGYVQHIHGFAKENVNRITNDDDLDPISGFPPLKYIPVRIWKTSMKDVNEGKPATEDR
ncbi:MAG: molybdopterin-dependent oxidoreductase [Tissierellia bacterium]|nr:molybdopterin-dependent oxidoreductase [Tissierellia bacterium]